MNVQRWLVAGAALVAAVSPSSAGPCTHDIDLVQHAIDARLDAKAGAGPMARESTAATMNRQPTPESIAAAEARLGDLSPEKMAAVRTAMTRAREADAAGDKSACEQALADVQRQLGR
jgi:hypothetical protein